MTSSGRGRPSRQSIRGRLFLLLLLAIAAAALLGRYFVVKQVEVDGLVLRPAKDVVAISGVRGGESMFRLDEARIKAGVESDPYLRFLGLEKRYPQTLILKVKESQPRAVVGSAGAMAVLDDDCRVLEVSAGSPDLNVLLITGVRVTVRRPGYLLETDVPTQVSALRALLVALRDQNVDGQAAELNVENLDNIYFVTKAGMQVRLGDSEHLKDKLQWFLAVSQQLGNEGVTGGTLDVSSGKNAVYSEG